MLARRKVRLGVAAVASALVVALPFLLSNQYYVHIANMMLYYIIAAVSLDIVAGYLGEISFGHAAFIAVGAYTVAILGNVLPNAWYSFWVALLAGGVAAVVAGIIVGVPALRIRGDFFFVVTMGFGEIIRFVLLNGGELTGGPFGKSVLVLPRIGGFVIQSRIQFYFLFLAGAILTVVIAHVLRQSYLGRAWIALREDENVAVAMGINLTYYKTLALSISAFLAGIGGGIFATYAVYVHPTDFNALASIMILAMVLLGGRGLIWGAVAGAVILTALNEVLRPVDQFRMLAIGVLIAAMMLFRPRGLFGKESARS